MPIYTNLIIDVRILFTFLFFWGCPARWAGRAVSGLALCSALRFFRYAQKARSGLTATLAHPSAIKSWLRQPRPYKKKLQLNQLELLRK